MKICHTSNSLLATTGGAGFGTDKDTDKDLFSSPVFQTSALGEEYDRAWELYADLNKGLYNFQENEPEHEPETPNEIY